MPLTVGSVYVDKTVLKSIGDPKSIKITMTETK